MIDGNAAARQRILDSLSPMFEEARAKGLWFFSLYQQLWFSPNHLSHEQSQGRFIWGAVNWKLRDPRERLAELRQDEMAARQAADRVEAAIAAMEESK